MKVLLKDLVDSHGEDHMENALEDCYIHMALGSFDDDMLRRIAKENNVDPQELKKNLKE